MPPGTASTAMVGVKQAEADRCRIAESMFLSRDWGKVECLGCLLAAVPTRRALAVTVQLW